MSAHAVPARYFEDTHGAWLAPLRDWPTAAMRALQSEIAVARVVVASVRGSAPREPGTCMLVERGRIVGTIGGGQLEWAAIESARALLGSSSGAPVRIQKLVLATELAQCCGGVVELWIERYTRADLQLLEAAAQALRHGQGLLISKLAHTRVERRVLDRSHDRARIRLECADDGSTVLHERLGEGAQPLWLYGAGHVGQALIRVLEQLPLHVTWIDSRAGLLPQDVAESVSVRHAVAPVDTVSAAPAAARFLVMTHSHPLDYALCRAVLERGDFAWAGVIGSKSKGARFRSRLARDGIPAEQIARLVCPIGVEGIGSKQPAAIAVAVAAQLLQTLEAPALLAAREAPPTSTAQCSADARACATCESRHGAM